MSAKRPINVVVDAELAERVEALGAEAPRLVEAALRTVLSSSDRPIRDEELAAAIASHNRYIDENGIWSEGFLTTRN
jgi:post-segregation antitoxin (ccd killing protein)